MDYIKKWRVNDDSLIGTVVQGGVPIAEVGPNKRTITATDAAHAKLLGQSNRFNPVGEAEADHPEEVATQTEDAAPAAPPADAPPITDDDTSPKTRKGKE